MENINGLCGQQGFWGKVKNALMTPFNKLTSLTHLLAFHIFNWGKEYEPLIIPLEIRKMSLNIANQVIPKIVFRNAILNLLDITDLKTCALVCKQWKGLVEGVFDKIKEKRIERAIISPEIWEKYMGKVDSSVMPDTLKEYMKGNCPYFSGKKVFQTSIAIYIPQWINDDVFSVNNFIALRLKRERKGLDGYFDKEVKKLCTHLLEKSYWMIITNETIPKSENKTIRQQVSLLKENDEAASILEVVVSLYLKSFLTNESIAKFPDIRTRDKAEKNGYFAIWCNRSNDIVTPALSVEKNNKHYGIQAVRKFE